MRLPRRFLNAACAGVCAFAAAPGSAGEGQDAAPARSVDSSVFPVAPAPGIPSLQMSTDYASPSLAISTYRPGAFGESTGMRVEPFTVRAGIHTGIGYNDNVSLSSSNRISSMFFTMSPTVAVGLEGELHRYYITYRGNYGKFFSSSADDYDDHNLALTAANDWTTRLRTLFLYEYVRGHDPRGTSTITGAEPDRWDVHAVRGTVTYGAVGAQGRLEGTAAYADKNYRTDLPGIASRDYETAEVGGTFFYRLAPKTEGLVEIRRGEVSHRSAAFSDSTEMRYLVGAAWEATARTSGSLRVGYMTKEPDNAAVPDFSSPSYEAVITWLPLERSRVTVNARRTFSEAVEPGGAYVVDDFVSVGWTHVWPRDFQSFVGYTFGDQRHEGTSRDDTYHSFDLKGSYALSRRLRLGAEYRHDMRKSPVPGFDFRRNITLLTVEGVL